RRIIPSEAEGNRRRRRQEAIARRQDTGADAVDGPVLLLPRRTVREVRPPRGRTQSEDQLEGTPVRQARRSSRRRFCEASKESLEAGAGNRGIAQIGGDVRFKTRA